MPKYWGKQIFTHGSFPEVGQKKKTERKRKKKDGTPGPIFSICLNEMIIVFDIHSIYSKVLKVPICQNSNPFFIQWEMKGAGVKCNFTTRQGNIQGILYSWACVWL